MGHRRVFRSNSENRAGRLAEDGQDFHQRGGDGEASDLELGCQVVPRQSQADQAIGPVRLQSGQVRSELRYSGSGLFSTFSVVFIFQQFFVQK